MRKLTKIILAFGISLTLMLGTEQRTVRAQGIPTLDIQNFISNILSFLQDSSLGGLFEDISDLEMKIQTFREHMQVFNEMREFITLVKNGAAYAKNIYYTTSRMLGGIERSYRYISWFTEAGASPLIIQAVMQSRDDFKSFYESLLEESENRTAFFDLITGKSQNSGKTQSVSVIEVLRALDDYSKELDSKFSVIESAFNTRTYKIYIRFKREKYAFENGRIFRQRVFY